MIMTSIELTLDVHRQNPYTRRQMILSYRDKKTEGFAKGEFVKAFQGFEDQAAKRLAILNAAPTLDTLRALPSNRLEEVSRLGLGPSTYCLKGSCSNRMS